MILGHFSTTGEAKIGIGFSNNAAASLIWFPRIRFDDRVTTGAFPDPAASLIELQPNTVHTWAYDWNPTGGIFGDGLLTVTLDGQTFEANLPAEKVAFGLTVDAFGLAGTPSSSDASVQFADLFIDDVSYSTAIIPEPSSLFLFIVGGLGLIGYGWRKKRRQAAQEL